MGQTIQEYWPRIAIGLLIFTCGVLAYVVARHDIEHDLLRENLINQIIELQAMQQSMATTLQERARYTNVFQQMQTDVASHTEHLKSIDAQLMRYSNRLEFLERRRSAESAP